MFTVVETGIARSKAPVNGTVRTGDRVHTTHVPKDPKTGAIVDGDMTVQMRRTLENLKIAMEAAGGTLRDVAQVLIFITDSSEFDAMNKVYVEYFSEPYPTRATVVVKELIGGKARVEIQAQAWLGK
jgi:enamine deaminase RidA (YjgF/YER057c/UK114 family)